MIIHQVRLMHPSKHYQVLFIIVGSPFSFFSLLCSLLFFALGVCVFHQRCSCRRYVFGTITLVCPRAVFWCCKIGPRGAEQLAMALRGNRSLTEIDLRENSLGPMGMKVIADALAGNGTLRTLHLQVRLFARLSLCDRVGVDYC